MKPTLLHLFLRLLLTHEHVLLWPFLDTKKKSLLSTQELLAIGAGVGVIGAGVGLIVGDEEGPMLGEVDGFSDKVGKEDGLPLGEVLGWSVGELEGLAEGPFDGL
jgi:hypothetical protein